MQLFRIVLKDEAVISFVFFLRIFINIINSITNMRVLQ